MIGQHSENNNLPAFSPSAISAVLASGLTYSPLWYKQQTRPAAVLLRYFTFYMDFYNPGRGKPRSMPSLSAGQV